MELSCLNFSLSLTIVLFVTNPCLTPTQGLYYADQWVGVNSHFKILVNERRFREQLALNARGAARSGKEISSQKRIV